MNTSAFSTNVLLASTVLASTTAACTSLVSAQQLQPRSLSKANAFLSEEFERIAGIRELRDGRVLIVDSREHRVVAADLRADAVAPVSRSGSGPREYRETHGLYALPGDSTLLEDRRSLRWILLDGIRPVATLPTWNAGYRGPAVRGADRRGRILEMRGFVFGRDSRGRTGRSDVYAESLFVLVHTRGAKKVDTVARLRGRYRGIWITPKDIGGGMRIDTEYQYCPVIGI